MVALVLPDAADGAFGAARGCEVLEWDGGEGAGGDGSGGGGEAVSCEEEEGWTRAGVGARAWRGQQI